MQLSRRFSSLNYPFSDLYNQKRGVTQQIMEDEQHYGQEVGSKKKRGAAAAAAKTTETEAVKKSSHVLRKLAKRKGDLETHLEEQFTSGRLLACVTSRPGQSGRADGYILEGKELEFYQKQLAKKKKGQK